MANMNHLPPPLGFEALEWQRASSVQLVRPEGPLQPVPGAALAPGKVPARTDHHRRLADLARQAALPVVEGHREPRGSDAASRTVFGNPDNSAQYGWENGVFFMYDPSINGDAGSSEDAREELGGAVKLQPTRRADRCLAASSSAGSSMPFCLMPTHGAPLEWHTAQGLSGSDYADFTALPPLASPRPPTHPATRADPSLRETFRMAAPTFLKACLIHRCSDVHALSARGHREQ